MIIDEAQGVPLLQFPMLAGFSEIVHGVSTRQGGVSSGCYSALNLGWNVGDDADAVAENRRRVYSRLGLDAARGAAGRQVHGIQVSVVRGEEAPGVDVAGSSIADTDALTTATPGVGLLVFAADCVPVLLWDPIRRVVGTVHAGWRGTVAGAVAAAISTMTREFGSKPQDIVAGIGPSIGACCYEVDGPVLEPLQAAFSDWRELVEPTSQDHAKLNLWEANRRLLVAAGVLPEHVDVAGICTRCHSDQFYSERADGRPLGRFGAIIAIREGR